jgi:hypothetical protein
MSLKDALNKRNAADNDQDQGGQLNQKETVCHHSTILFVPTPSPRIRY